MIRHYLLVFLLIIFSGPAFGLRTTGRLTFGLATSTERFSSSDFGSDKNDTLFSSQRVYYKVSEVGDNKWEVTTDLRNKYDAFDKLNQTAYQLDPKDEFQARQLSVRMVNPEGQWSPIFGRFQVPESGAVFVDGADLEYRFSPELYSGVFAGLNPKQIDKAYLVSDSKANQAGVFLTYQKKSDGWDTNRYLTHGFVQQSYNGQSERQFIFHNGIYQWQADSRIISMAYFDFVPKTYVQTMYLIYQQSLSRYFASEIGLLGIDVLEYQRRQGLLERLNASPYKEAHINFEYKTDRDSTVTLTALSGERSSDQLKRTDLSLAYRLQSFITKNWDTQVRLSNRKNFTSQDNLLSWSLGYFSNSYEIVGDADYAIQKNNDGTTTHPLNTELSLTSFFSKDLFISAVLQRAADESVTILGTFVKVGYRFGNRELPPIRDGAAPRGSL